MLIMMAGLPGTGKSTLSRALAQRPDGVVLDKDLVRAALFPAPHIEYSREQDDFCQRVMLSAAEFLLSRTPRLWIFLDGHFPVAISAARWRRQPPGCARRWLLSSAFAVRRLRSPACRAIAKPVLT